MQKEDTVLFCIQVQTQANIRALFASGTLSPMQTLIIVKALLAHRDEARLSAFVNKGQFEKLIDH